MGIFSKRNRELFAAASALPENSTMSLPGGVLSPAVALAPVLFPIVDHSQYPVSAAEALAVPAVSKALKLYTSISSRFVLDSNDNSTPWLSSGYGFVTPQMRIAFSVTDLIFYNCTMWKVERDSEGTIIEAQHIARHRWNVDSQGIAKVDDKVVSASDLIYFSGLMPGGGFLEDGRNSVRQYTSIAATINSRAKTAEPVVIIEETMESGATAEEVQQVKEEYVASMQAGVSGGTVFQPYGMNIRGFGASDNANAMMTDARNAIRLDLANFLNISASLLEGAADGSSDTYTNTLLVQNELLELSIKAFTEPIADRLSMNDVTPEGTTVRFDYSSFDTAPNDSTNGKGTVPAPTEEETND